MHMKSNTIFHATSTRGERLNRQSRGISVVMKSILYCVALALCGVLFHPGSLRAADRTSADALLTGVPDLVKDGNFKTIEELCKRSLQSDDSCPSAHFYLGMAYEHSNKPREAVKEYLASASCATKEKDGVMAGKANAAAKKIGAGVIDLDALDAKYADKLGKVGTDAFDAGQLETARQAFSALLVLRPSDAKGKEGLDKAAKALEERGDPVKSKIAAASLSEVWFKLGIGELDKAKELAQTLSSNYGDTEPGKEAAALIERNFAAPKHDEVAKLTEKLKQESAKKIAAAPKTPSTTVTSSPGTAPAKAAGGPRVDVDATQKLAEEDAKKMSKDALIPAFKDAHKKGKEHYAKATPGSEGNQDNIAKALEQFIKADSLYTRIENENMSTEELAANAKEVGMLHYACLKMTILAH